MLRERTDPLTGEVLLTMDQVRDIVRRAVDEKERSLREQYDRILQQKLQGAHAGPAPPPTRR